MFISELQTFFAWMTAINFGLLLFASVLLIGLGRTIKRIHQRLTGVDQKHLPRIYFNFLAVYKLLILIFNLTPYLALCLMQ